MSREQTRASDAAAAKVGAPLAIPEERHGAAEIDAALRALDDQALADLLGATREAARAARRVPDMDRVIELTRGMKTLHRIAAERGLIFRRTR